MRRIWGIAGALVLVGLAACGNDDTTIAASGDPGEPMPASAGPAPTDPDQRYRWRGWVFEDETHGPLLCLALLDSYPPQCSDGPAAIGFEWTAIDHERRHATRWGTYELIGTWTDHTFTITEAREYEFPTPSASDHDPLPMPCDEPTIGEQTPSEAVDPLADYVSAQPDQAGGWWVDGVPVVLFTGDVDRHRDEIGSLVDGPFCVTWGPRTYGELEEMMVSLAHAHDAVSSAMAFERGGIDLTLWVDDPGLQAELDDRYGPGVVRVSGHLEPVD